MHEEPPDGATDRSGTETDTPNTTVDYDDDDASTPGTHAVDAAFHELRDECFNKDDRLHAGSDADDAGAFFAAVVVSESTEAELFEIAAQMRVLKDRLRGLLYTGD